MLYSQGFPRPARVATLVLLAVLAVAAPRSVAQTAEAEAAAPVDAEVPVKKSRASICHPRGTLGYKQTQRYTAFDSVAACLASGGRLPAGMSMPQDAAATVPTDKAVFDSEDPRFIRRSRGGVCYEASDGNYLRLLYYKAYLTMDDCLQSGGRRADVAEEQRDGKPRQ